MVSGMPVRRKQVLAATCAAAGKSPDALRGMSENPPRSSCLATWDPVCSRGQTLSQGSAYLSKRNLSAYKNKQVLNTYRCIRCGSKPAICGGPADASLV